MKIFLSWSGDLSREVAEIIRKFLPCMIQDLQVFMSKHDIESGARWTLQLAKELEDSSFGIICLTADNLQSSWLLFEAGALTKHVEGRACGLLLNNLKPTDVTGPLAQFQNRPFEKSEFRLLLKDINSRLPNPLGEQQLDMVFEKWWPDILQEYELSLKKSVSNTRTPVQRDERDLLEEVLMKVRGIERRLGAPYGLTPRSLTDISLEGFVIQPLIPETFINFASTKEPGIKWEDFAPGIYNQLRKLRVDTVEQLTTAIENVQARKSLEEIYERLLKRKPDWIGIFAYQPIIYLYEEGKEIVEQSVLASPEYRNLQKS